MLLNDNKRRNTRPRLWPTNLRIYADYNMVLFNISFLSACMSACLPRVRELYNGFGLQSRDPQLRYVIFHSYPKLVNGYVLRNIYSCVESYLVHMNVRSLRSPDTTTLIIANFIMGVRAVTNFIKERYTWHKPFVASYTNVPDLTASARIPSLKETQQVIADRDLT